MMSSTHRKNLLSIFHAGLDAVRGDTAVQRYFFHRPIMAGPVFLISIGKAATAMAEGALAVLGEKIVAGLVVTKYEHGKALPFDSMEAAHPIPDENSLLAGEKLLAFVDCIPLGAQVLFLLSGGASSLVEVLRPGVTVSDLQALNHACLSEAMSIEAINAKRCQLSMIKGGGLAERLQGRRVLQLCVSDIPGDRVAAIGSGLLFPNTEIETHVVATLSDCLVACERAAQEMGYAVTLWSDQITAEADQVGQQLATALCQRQTGLIIAGGETVVQLPEYPGQGGRNQHLALSAALALHHQPQVALLAMSTDGTDGPGDMSGAIVDGQTITRGRACGLDPQLALRQADSGRFLAASGDLVRTGPTGTNVMDVVMGLRW